MPIEIPKDKWPGSIKAITIGAIAAEGGTRTRTVTVGGQTTMPYLQYEAPTPNKPVIAIEIKSRKPEDWSALLAETCPTLASKLFTIITESNFRNKGGTNAHRNTQR